MSTSQPVLVVGATGFLGRQVVDALQRRGRSVRAVVRPGSDASALTERGVEVVRGDLLDRGSLEAAMVGADAVVTSAVGYTRRRKGDSGATTDTVGNRNLGDAALAVGVRRLVFTGILAAERAPDVPHFRHKSEAEDYFAGIGLPYVSLRPGAFLDQVLGSMPGGGPASGRLFSIGSPTVPMTWVLSADLADALAAAVDAPVRDGEHVDLGWTVPVSTRDIADTSDRLLGRRVRVWPVPWPLLSGLLGLVGLLDSRAADGRAMFRFFQTGRFVADPTRQAELFGVPTPADALGRWLGTAPASVPSAP